MRRMQWSDVARSPREVAAAVDSAGQVCLERRGHVSLVVTRADRTEQARQGLDATGRILRDVLAHQDREGLLEQTLINALPWARFLPEADRREFVKEFVGTVEACSDLDVWAPLGRMLEEWRVTATVHADPVLAAELSRPVDADLGPVPMPTLEDAADAGSEG